MREYPQTWQDHDGSIHKVPSGKLKPASIPLHARLRAFVFKRDGFTCMACGTKPIEIPAVFDGRSTLFVPRRSKAGFESVLVIDHCRSRRNGGSNHPDNLGTFCGICNAQKVGLLDTPMGRAGYGTR